MKRQINESLIHRAALLNEPPMLGEITAAESKRAGEWERQAVKDAEDFAANYRAKALTRQQAMGTSKG
jgi:hypothetical protein